MRMGVNWSDNITGCSGYVHSHAGHLYNLCETREPYTVAKYNCENEGGYLVEIDDQAENDFVAQLISWVFQFHKVHSFKAITPTVYKT